MRYIINKLWPLILLLMFSVLNAVLGIFRGAFGTFLDAYLRFALYVIGMGLIMHFVGEAFPRRFSADDGLFHSASFEEDGYLYERLFRVSRWKDGRFDASRAFPDTKEKSIGIGRDPDAMDDAVQEMCVAELTHLILILFSPLLLILIRSGWRWPFWGLYVLFNFSDIIIQRYNRPRLCRLSEKLRARKEAAL